MIFPRLYGERAMTSGRMRRFGVCALALCAAGFVFSIAGGPAIDATAQTPRITAQPVLPNPATVPGTDAYEINQLKQEVAGLRMLVETFQRQFADESRRTNASIAAVSSGIGNLRRPVCVNDRTLRDPVNGRSENCAPFQCEPVSGTCREVCRSTQDCAAGFVCSNGDAGGGHCTSP